jgi:hypothetical protein
MTTLTPAAPVAPSLEGVSLKAQLRRAERKRKLRAVLMILERVPDSS